MSISRCSTCGCWSWRCCQSCPGAAKFEAALWGSLQVQDVSVLERAPKLARKPKIFFCVDLQEQDVWVLERALLPKLSASCKV